MGWFALIVANTNQDTQTKMSVATAKLKPSTRKVIMTTNTIIRIATKGSEAFDIILTAEQVENTLEWATDQYYKGGIETFWVNGVEFEEPLPEM